MAKQTGGLLAFGARGQIAKTLVFSSWRGVGYSRRYVIPANPKTTAQLSTRNVFTFLSNVWKSAPTLFQDPWTSYATGQPLTNRNAFNKFNIAVLRAITTLLGMVGSPGSKGGIAATSATVTPGVGTLTVAVTAPSPPTGWTLTSAIAACIKDQDAHVGTDYTITAGEDLTSPYSIMLSGLTSSVAYRVWYWLKWTKPDGTIAYGPSIETTGTPS